LKKTFKMELHKIHEDFNCVNQTTCIGAMSQGSESSANPMKLV
jgi:hypothetical protein